MTVLLSLHEVFANAIAGTNAFNDALSGAGTGIDFGPVNAGAFAPIVSQPANTGKKDIFLRHDGTNKITSVGTFLAPYSQTYGGADSAANDFTTIKAKGAASSSANANNDDGNAGGLHVEMDADVSTANQFDPSREGVQVRIYGSDPGLGVDSGKNGNDLANAFTLEADAMVYDSGGETIPSTPVAGEIGPIGGGSEATIGEVAHTRYRFFLEGAASVGGVIQGDLVYTYSFTS